MADGFWATLTRLLGLGRKLLDEQATKPEQTRTRTRPKPQTAPRPAPPQPATGYAGDFTGHAKITYAPTPDGDPDPGEVVWAWVPFEEDHSQGKDRPVLVIAEHRGKVLGLMLTSQDHDRDAAREARYGRIWMDVGTGDWDRQGRPSEVRLDRVLQLDPRSVRREGAAMDRSMFDKVASATRKAKGW